MRYFQNSCHGKNHKSSETVAEALELTKKLVNQNVGGLAGAGPLTNLVSMRDRYSGNCI